ncbi:MAG: ferredoxin-thioredoxin reductase catalytic domain-containing protein [Candidatus Hadarchaeales archaeon]
MDQEIYELRKRMERYARMKGYSLNPDEGIVNMILRGLLENKKRHGYQYCPCRALTGNPAEDQPKICPCRWHEEEIRTMGRCHCGLFVKKEIFEEVKN